MLEQNRVLGEIENSFLRKQMDKANQDKPRGLFARVAQKVNDDAEAQDDASDFV